RVWWSVCPKSSECLKTHSLILPHHRFAFPTDSATQKRARMEWSLESVREMVAGGMQSIRECEICAFAIAMCVLLLFMWYCYRVGREHGSSPLRGRYLAGTGRIGECFRCTSAGESLNQRLYHSLQEYAKRYTWSGMGRVHKGVRDQGRYLNSRPTIQRPEVSSCPTCRHFPALLAEFESIYHQPPGRSGSSLPPGWKANNTPRGQWWTYYLVNQGTPLVLNVRRCPRAWRVLGQLRTFISNNVFGNACFSHYGPTNVRLRCHLGLRVPPSCELVVGGEPQCWSEGSCLLFDDSFLHRAFHEGSQEDGPGCFHGGPVAPNVAAAERQALDYIFTPGRLEDREGK
uniref:Aspartate beta-hydroxylase domain containing 2 n=1 Tax=Maylandia zebra TaxID=106582 RepID=A0A3P9DGL9_9CICH